MHTCENALKQFSFQKCQRKKTRFGKQFMSYKMINIPYERSVKKQFKMGKKMSK